MKPVDQEADRGKLMELRWIERNIPTSIKGEEGRYGKERVLQYRDRTAINPLDEWIDVPVVIQPSDRRELTPCPIGESDEIPE